MKKDKEHKQSIAKMLRDFADDIENKETIRDVSFKHSVIGVPNLGYENYTDYEIKIEYRQHYDSK